MNRRTIIAIIGLVLVTLSMSAYAQQPLTLEDAIRIGLQRNFDVRIARNNARIADNNSGIGTAGFLPTVNLSGNYQSASTDESSNSASSFGDSDTESWGGTISLEWTLFDGFKMFVERKKYYELAKLGEYQARYLIENSVVAIARAYFDLVQQEKLLDAAKENKDISETRFQKEAVRKELGGSSSTDYLNAQVAFNRDRSTLLSQELNVITARKDLNVLLGRNPDEQITVVKEIVITPLGHDFTDILESALENSSELKVAKQNKKIADREAGSAYSDFLPRLSLNASYGYADRTITSNLTDDIITERYDATIGLNLSFNLFNGGRDRIAWQNARLESESQQLALEDTRNRLEGMTREAYEAFENQMELVGLEQQNEQTARQNLELIQEKYRIGAVSSLEFRDAQVSLLNAQVSLITAKYQARITRIQIEQLTGEIDID
jgi:outer membrane protein TolC